MIRSAAAATLVILAIAAACDNIQWGGTEIDVVPPPPRTEAHEPVPVEPTEERLPDGPILFLARGHSEQAVLLPIGQIVGDSMLPVKATADREVFGESFISRFFPPGAEFMLFSNGAPAGTFLVESASVPDTGICPGTPKAMGTLELADAAGSANEFLALAGPHAPVPAPAGTPSQLQQRIRSVIAPNLADQLLRNRRAALPDNWARATAQIEPIPFEGLENHGFAATFLVGDTLGPGLDDHGHSLFFIAKPHVRTGYDTVFVQFRDYARTGKAAPRVIDYLDWNHDGQVGLVLEVFGTSETWFEAVAFAEDRWRKVLEFRCGRPESLFRNTPPEASSQGGIELAGFFPAP